MSGDAVRLTGFLVCADEAQAAAVRAHLPAHLDSTRAEPGCVAFDVVPLPDDPLRWRVEETFRDAAAFDAHRRRVADSAWGRATTGIGRDYTLDGR